MSNFIERYVTELKDAMSREEEALAEGGPQSYEEYRYKVGFRRGLKKALMILEDTVADMRKRGEDFF